MESQNLPLSFKPDYAGSAVGGSIFDLAVSYMLNAIIEDEKRIASSANPQSATHLTFGESINKHYGEAPVTVPLKWPE